jgi:hypothetical protein
VAFQQPNLRVGQHERLLASMALEPHQSLVARLDIVAKPDTSDAASADVHVVEAELIRNALRAVSRGLQRVIENPRLDVRSDAVWMRIGRTTLLLDERSHATDLEGALHLVERVAVIAHQFAGLRDVAELFGELRQRQCP